MKKKILLSLASILAIASVGGCACKKDNSASELTFDELYTLSAISGINMLTNHNTNTGLSTSLDQTSKDQIIENLQIVENMLYEGIIKSDESSSNKEGYEKMYTIKVSSIDGSKEEYSFHYNETRVKSDDWDEKEYRLEGIVIKDNIEYKMIGEKESEGKEIEMSFKLINDSNNYILIEQEMENNEQEFEFTQYKDGRKVYSKELEFEKKKNGKMEIELEEREGNLTKIYSYQSITINGKEYIEVRYNNGNESFTFNVTVDVDESGNKVYTFN